MGKSAVVASMLVVLMVAPGFGVMMGQAQFVDPSCTVGPGMSIQSALDQAAPGARVVVCPGFYSQSIMIRRSDVWLEGRPGAILDGTALVGTRYAIQIFDVRDITVSGFEIRNYKNPLASTGDASSGIVAMSASTNVWLRNMHIHHNAFAGIISGSANVVDWKIEANRFSNQSFAHVMAQSASHINITNNTFDGAKHAILIGGGENVEISDNKIQGAGRGAITVSLSLNTREPTRNLDITNNTVTGTWTHGIWTTDARDAHLNDNNVTVNGNAITIGGDPEERTLENNQGQTVEQPNLNDVYVTYQLVEPAPVLETENRHPAHSVLGCGTHARVERRDGLAQRTNQHPLRHLRGFGD